MIQAYSRNGRRYRPRGFPDYYAALGVTQDATFRAIESAYWAKAFKVNPAQLDLLNEAYEVLGDDQKRRAYDVERRLNGG